ncbi:elongation factor G [uncultured Ilyobacter sp.]|uniref:elongation factor G n=1 Tax=uncultured Ilyobacter sp. TaxID=544433 RepID=UPI0029F4C84E|nr:elongation factor G [uncultured Ilyobacter sp.]
MAAKDVAAIRNVAFVGHTGAGMTSIGEAILHKAGVTNRLGSVDDGTSMLNYDEEEKERAQSLESAFYHIEHNGTLINAFDTPGTPDYSGTAIASLAAVETAIVVIGANGGIGVNTRRMFNLAGDYGLARMIVINRIDADNVNLEDILGGIRETFGAQCHPVFLPADGGKKMINVLDKAEGAADVLDVASCHTGVVEAIVETDDALMEAYMEAGEISPEKLKPAISKAVAAGSLVPIVFTNARGEIGIDELLEAIVSCCPSPANGKKRVLVTGEGDDKQERVLEPDASADFVCQVVKITTDPKSNIKYSVARIHSGTLKGDGSIFTATDRKGQRTGHPLKLCGDQHAEIEGAGPGDIIAFAKLDVAIGDTLFDKASEGAIKMPKIPSPMYALAIEPKARGDVEKISVALHRFAEEDPCFNYERDSETNELVMQGMGDLHLTVLRAKMKRYFKMEVDTKPPKIPYRETISGSVKYVEYTHKKQSGGAGQFARVFIDMEPAERGEGYEFVDKIFGGSIDQPFRPSVDKGIRAQMVKGVIAGCPVVDVKVSLVDGKTHPVDSKDIAFQIAGRQVFKKAFMQCKPILLEPIVTMEVIAPTDFMGDITRDLAGKRGQILGQDILPGSQVAIRANVPLSEVAAYASQLKSVTGGQGSYTMEFDRYDVVPPNVQQQIVAAVEKKDDDEE